MSKTDTALADARARDGDRAAFEELVRRTSRLVFASLYVDTGPVDRVEDLLQETFLLAFRALRTLEDPAGFRPWLLTIAHNVVIDDARRSAQQARAAPSADTYLTRVPSSEPPPDELAARSELRPAGAQCVAFVAVGVPFAAHAPVHHRGRLRQHQRATRADQRFAAGAAAPQCLKMLRDRLPPGLVAEFEE